ncbi:MAG: N-acetylglucosamine-6-phosphate deacetylase [Opitutaceae bacterium]|nr:N-acetylglucosamine-6-phosphate deacetylase [Opitutaceae bacterium]
MTASSAFPNLFDFQVNGYAGVDFQSDDLTPDDLGRAVEGLRRDGAGGILLTLITDEEAALVSRFRRVESFRQADARLAAMIRGYHLEGPWLNPEPGYCGAHPPAAMCAPSLDSFDRLQEAAGGAIRLVTLAPEWPGSAAMIAGLRGRGVQVSLGHTNASHEQIDVAIGAGAKFCTHLGNGVPGVLPRHDNVVQRLLARDELTACFIPDGIHLPPFVLKNFVRAKPAGRVLFTTDAMSAAGGPPGTYRIARMEVAVGADGVVRGPHGGFAGSSLTPQQGVDRVATFLGLSLAESRKRWSTDAWTAFGFAPDGS